MRNQFRTTTVARGAAGASLGAALLLAAAGSWGAGAGAARPLAPVVRGQRPFTETLGQIARRDQQIRAQNRVLLGGRTVLKAPIEPEFGEDELLVGKDDPNSAAPSPPSRRPQAPQRAGVSFDGIDLDQLPGVNGGFAFIPPDTQGAVGPNHFVEATNGGVAVFSKTGVRQSLVSLDAFFTVMVDGVTHPVNGTFDPRVRYDRRSGRWFACTLDNGGGPNNSVLLAVSRTNDPTGTWDRYAITLGDASHWADYPSLGIDANGVYLGVNMFTTGSNSFTGTRIAAVAMAPLLGVNPTLNAFASGSATLMFTPQAADNLDPMGAGDPAWFVGTGINGGLVANAVRYQTMTWSNGTPSLSGPTDVSIQSFANPVPVPASGSSVPVDGGDTRLQMAVIRGGHLWTCRTVGVNSTGSSSGTDRCGVSWLDLRLTGTSAVLNQEGRVWDPAGSGFRHYFYPSIMPSGQGHVALGFSGAKNSEFVGTFTCGRLAGDPAGSMGAPVLLRAGDASYTLTFGGPRNRWGDYSCTSLDPNDDQTLWTIQEYAGTLGGFGTGRWVTRISQLLAPAPTLNNPGAIGVAGAAGVSFALTGTGFFDPGAGFPKRPTVTVSGGGISNAAVSAVTPTGALVTLDVDAAAAEGARDITFTNPDGQSVTVAGGLTIQGSDAIGLSADRYTAAEAAGSAQVTIRRALTSGEASVDFATSDGSAGSGADYTTTTGTRSLADGVAQAAVSVPVADDAAIEADETFTFTLSNPVGTSLGSPSSATVTITDDRAKPAPSGLAVTGTTTTSASLQWTDNCSNETGFEIQFSTDGGATWSAPPAVDASAGTGGTVSATVPGLKPKTSYTFRVRAVAGVIASDFGATAAGKTKTKPAAPTNLKVKVTSTTSARLTWTDNANNEEGFKLEISTDGGRTFPKVVSVPAHAGKGTVSANRKKLKHGKKHTFRVRAFLGEEFSAYSNKVSAKP
jgi:hypothetical protein